MWCPSQEPCGWLPSWRIRVPGPQDRLPDRPENFGEMVRLAEAISAPFPHVRVDLYNVDGLIRFGELTFFNASGYMLYEPDCFDREIGDRFSLPQRRERPGGGAS